MRGLCLEDLGKVGITNKSSTKNIQVYFKCTVTKTQTYTRTLQSIWRIFPRQIYTFCMYLLEARWKPNLNKMWSLSWTSTWSEIHCLLSYFIYLFLAIFLFHFINYWGLQQFCLKHAHIDVSRSNIHSVTQAWNVPCTFCIL